MKKIFTTIDVLAIVEELKETVVGLRVNQVYDIDHKTYLLKLQKPDHKVVLLLESASRIHSTEYEWPKSPAPSWFSMKLRRYLRNKRLENVEQLGVDRIVDLTFGSGEAEQHLIIELYDRGNIILTDGEFNILNVLRPRKEGEETKIVANEKYPVENARKARSPPSLQDLEQAFTDAKDNLPLKKILNPLLDCGGSVLDHALLNAGFLPGVKKGKNSEINLEDVHKAVTEAQLSVVESTSGSEKKGYVVKKLIQRTREDGSTEDIFLFEEFHPRLYNQHKDLPVDEFPSFNKACDEYFSKLEANEVDKKVVQKEKEALKKLENVRKDHEKRLQELKGKQEEDMKRGQLIELNQQLVEGALLVVRSAIANQIDWQHIQELLDEAQARKDPIACAIRALKLEQNAITLWLSDPYDCDENDMLLDSDEEREQGTESEKMRPMTVDINLDFSALANARRYYNMKRQAAKKEQKTIDASYKAIKSAEKKTQQTLKEVNTIANINKARKVHWFEKFLWFVSSENYLVLGGRDSQQNEQVVKRHLKPKDVYVHADLHGASSVVIKNPSGGSVPPRTLHEAGIMALCYSRAWDEKVVTSAWWVWGQQVSKTAPAGEYLTTGAFMVRGKKNYLPPSHLVYGFGFLFRLEEGSVPRHEGERRARTQDDLSTAISDALEKLTAGSDEEEVEISVDDDNDNDQEVDEKEPSIKEENESEEEEQKEEREEEEEKEEDEGLSEKMKPFTGIKKEELEDPQPVEQFPDTELEISHLKGDQRHHPERPAKQSTPTPLPSRKELQRQAANPKEKAYAYAGQDHGAPEPQKHPTDGTPPEASEDGEGHGSGLKARVADSTTEDSAKGGRQIYFGDDEPLLLTSQKDKKKSKDAGHDKSQKKMTQEKKQESKEELKEKNVLKRGQRGKMKKMKKYKDQDDEERELRMQLLQSSGNKKQTKKEIRKSNRNKSFQNKRPKTAPAAISSEVKDDSKTVIEDKAEEDLEDEELKQVSDDLTILKELTAIPVLEDELLYAIPVCAPYTCMTNYKFKIKLTPGPGKKGKACKTAISLFLADKTGTNREKDLLRAVKDHDLAKNIPGKVKVSAPNIHKIKK